MLTGIVKEVKGKADQEGWGSQVSVHTFSSFWKSKCMGLNGVFVLLQKINSCPKQSTSVGKNQH